MKVLLFLLILLPLLITGCSNDNSTAVRQPAPALLEEVIWRVPVREITSENASSLQLSGHLEGHQGTIFRSRFNTDGQRYLTIGGDQALIVWDMQNGQPLLQIPGLDIKQAFFTADDLLLTLDAQDKLGKWSLIERRQVESVALGQIFTAAALSPDQDQIAIGFYNGTVSLYDVETLEPALTIQAHQGGFQVADIYFSPDGRSLYTIGGEGSISRWLMENGEFMQEIDRHYPPPLMTAVSPDREVLAAVYRNELRFYELGRGSLLHTITVPFKEHIGALTFSPDGNWLAIGGDADQVMLYEVESGDLLAGLPGHGTTFDDLAFSPSGEMLLTSASEKGVFLWDLRSVRNNEDQTVQLPSAPLNQVPGLQIYGVDWSSDGRQIILIDTRGSAFVLSTP